MAIKCCKDCVAPKRYPGCHAQCPEYIAEKAEHLKLKEEWDRKNKISSDIRGQRALAVEKAIRKHRGKSK